MRIVIVSLVALMLILAATPSAPTLYQARLSAAPANPVDQAKTELNTAKTHAGFAAASDSLNGVYQHTGHAVNCLVGPTERRFDKKWGNVCEGQGSGVLTDLKSAGARGAAALKIAENATKVGMDALNAKDLKAAQNGAKKLGGLLDDALKAIK
jgi:hypothetical protein